ncbi:MAG TPA: metal-dependent hydrolase [Acidobacteriaceae bacterium]|nr:metal-dependent hydrolase [Acidobacteriaceae bacterium]
MEPVTHVLTGACLARAGFNRRAAYATFAMAAAAELPDIDSLWGFRGPVEALQHHRGITHTFLGVPFEAAFVVLVCYAIHRWRAGRYAKRPKPAVDADHVPIERPLTAAPVRWGALYGFAIIALLSHLLLDYTNNYGLRPFYPFNSHWYAASIVFIFDPLIFAVLLMGLIVPPIFRMVSSEVSARRQPFTGTGWPIAALFLILAVWGVRWIEHDRATQLAMGQSLQAPAPPESSGQTTDQTTGQAIDQSAAKLPTYLAAQRVLANPDPLSVFRWYTVTDFGPVYQLERADTREQEIAATEGTYDKPDATVALIAAERSKLGRVYLDWSPMPILSADSSRAAVEQAMADADEAPPVRGTVVTFRDPRFMGVLPWQSRGSSSPLTGVVVLDQQNRVVFESLSGHAEPAR